MPRFNPYFGPNNHDESSSRAYILLILLTGLAVAVVALVRHAESYNRLNYDNRFARIIAGLLMIIANTFHTKRGDIALPDGANTILAIGPHFTGGDAVIVGSKMKGTPPRFFATDGFNYVPGIKAFLEMFKTIPVKAMAKSENGRTANAGSLDLASTILKENGCVALFPQGNFARIGQEPPRVYPGAARLAVESKVPIRIVVLSGFWCLQNPLIPLSIRNNTNYRVLFSAFHWNNVTVLDCGTINYHLDPKNDSLSADQKIEEISAQLYAYFRHTQCLTKEQIPNIQKEIASGAHRDIWQNKLKQDTAEKQLVALKQEGARLEEPTLRGMRSA